MSTLGYIVSSFDEDQTVVPSTEPKKLFKVFADALREASYIYTSYIDLHEDELYGPFQLNKASKKQVDEVGGVCVFQGRTFWVWINRVYS